MQTFVGAASPQPAAVAVAARGAVALRGLARGLRSPPFSALDLVAAACAAPDPAAVLVDVDGDGRLSCGGGGARAAVRARPAPHVHACNAEVSRAGGGQLELRVVRGAPPLGELHPWLHRDLLAELHVPHLTLAHIRREGEYACDACGARFEDPNPLKMHLFLRCAPPAPARFWREVGARLAAAPAPPAGTEVAPRASAFRRVSPAPPEDAAARLEALAAEWGRSARGHACVYCGKLYSRKYGLKIHIRTHTGYRPLRCRHCLRAFGDPSNLNKHVRLHAAAGAGAGGGGAHRCPRCGRALARRRDLQRHLRAPCVAAAPPSP